MEQFWQSSESVPDGTRQLCSEGSPETLKSTKCLNLIKSINARGLFELLFLCDNLPNS